MSTSVLMQENARRCILTSSDRFKISIRSINWKTYCRKYQDERVKLVSSTWLRNLTHYGFGDMESVLISNKSTLLVKVAYVIM